MSKLTDLLQGAATEAQAFLGVSATLAGVPITCVVNTAAQAEDVMIGGRLVTLTLTVVATRNQAAFLTLTPAIGQTFVYGGSTYKVLTKGADELNYLLGCGQVNQ